jgi:hypothetical protein
VTSDDAERSALRAAGLSLGMAVVGALVAWMLATGGW